MEQDLKAALNNSSIIINLITKSSQAALRWKRCPCFVEAEIQASRNEAIIPRDAGEKKGSGFLGRRVFYGATLPPSRDQVNRCGNSLLVIFSSLVGA